MLFSLVTEWRPLRVANLLSYHYVVLYLVSRSAQYFLLKTKFVFSRWQHSSSVLVILRKMHWEWGNLVEIFLQCNITHRGSGVVDLERVNIYDQVSWEMAAESGFVISRSVYLASVRCFLMELRDTRKKYSYMYQSNIYALRLTTAINTNIKTVARFSCHAGDHQRHFNTCSDKVSTRPESLFVT